MTTSTMLLVNLAFSLLSSRAPFVQRYDGALCYQNSSIPGEPRVVSFYHNGDCSAKNRKPINLQGSHSELYMAVYEAAGLTIRRDHQDSKQLITFNDCTKNCVFNRSNFTAGMQISQIAGLLAFTNKRNLAQNVQLFQALHPGARTTVPRTFSYPSQSVQLIQDNVSYNGFYIFKPAVSSRGRGIQLIKHMDELQAMNATGIVQRYEELVLVGGHKFDMRTYLLFTSIDPLIAYFYSQGIARLAAHQYEAPTSSNYRDQMMHLTNAAINTGHVAQDVESGLSSKLDMRRLLRAIELGWAEVQEKGGLVSRKYLDYASGVSTVPEQELETQHSLPKNTLYAELKKTMETAVAGFYQNMLERAGQLPRVFEYPKQQFGMYGGDFGLRRDGTFVLFELNLMPDLSTDNRIDQLVKYPMLREMMELIGIREMPFWFPTEGNEDELSSELRQQYDGLFASAKNFSIREKRIMLQLVDELRRRNSWELLMPYDMISDGAHNKLVADNIDLIWREVDGVQRPSLQPKQEL